MDSVIDLEVGEMAEKNGATLFPFRFLLFVKVSTFSTIRRVIHTRLYLRD